jgi:adenylate cyclase
VWQLQILLLIAMVGANLVGSCVVFVLAAIVIPSPEVADPSQVRLENLVAAGIYVAVAVPIGIYLGVRGLLGVRRWLLEEREPDEREQRLVLRAPLRLFWVVSGLWLLATFVFAAFNATNGAELAVYVAIVVFLSGISTAAVAYLLAERIGRSVAARALQSGVPDRVAVRSVTVRALFAWSLGTGVPVLGLVLVALSVLTIADASETELAITILALGGIALTVGLLAEFVAAKASSDPIKSVHKALAAVEEGELDVEVPVYDGTQIGQLQAGFNRMVAGLREREQIRDLFGRHVGEDVAREALGRGVGLGGEVREVAVLFVDLVGSTSLAANRPPDEVVEMLNRFFDVVVEVVEQHDGWVNKFEGDAALAIWGAPVPVERRDTRVLAAARTMGERLGREIPELRAGIGVSGGPAVAGNVGAARRFEYTVIGDPVNEAARLTELAKSVPGHVVANAELLGRADAEEAARWDVRDEVVLRGREEATCVAAPRGAERAAGVAPRGPQ